MSTTDPATASQPSIVNVGDLIAAEGSRGTADRQSPAYALGYAESMFKRALYDVKYRTTSGVGHPNPTGYEYVEIPLWAARRLLDLIDCAFDKAGGAA